MGHQFGPAALATCENGRFYECLNTDGTDRSEFKRRVFIDLFFGEDRHPSKVRDDFRQTFPTVSSVLTDLKSADYRRLAWMMQHEESTLFIGRICRRLMRECSGMFVATIHDSLVTTADNIAYVESVALDEFEQLGMAPTFTRETFD